MSDIFGAELLPCPFCGGMAEWEYKPGGDGTGWVECQGCRVRVNGDRDDAERRWNARHNKEGFEMVMSMKKAKEHCGYEAKPVLPTCGNCGAFASDLEIPAWAMEPGNESIREEFEHGGHAKVEKNLRCTDHGFATKKMAACKLWRAKSEKPESRAAAASEGEEDETSDGR